MPKRSRANNLFTPPLPEAARPPERRNAKFTQVMCVARGLFLTRGFDAMTMDVIARASGVSKATLYAHFKSKEELFLVVVQDESERINSGVWDGLDESGEIDDVLRRIGRNFCSVFITDRTFMMQRAVTGAIARFPDIGRHVYQNGPVKMIEQMSAFLLRAKTDGKLQFDHPAMAGAHFLDLVRGDADLRGMLALELPSDAEQEVRINKAVEIFLKYYGAAKLGLS